MLVNPNDIYIGRSLIHQGVWEPTTRGRFLQFIKSGMKVLDLGANIGAHTLYMSKLAGDTGKVYAFEPCKINHDILLYNCIQNKLSNVTVYNLGASDRENTMFINAKFSECKNDGNYGFIPLKDSADEGDGQVETITIDSLNLHIDFAKIDVEGMEDRVLVGMKETILRCKPVMIVEIHQDDVPKVGSILESYGYKYMFIGGYDYLAIPVS